MAENYLITGYWGEPHVTAENDRGINAAIFGAGRFVLPVGEQFRAEYIGNNTVRLYDGKLLDNGAAAGIPAGEYIDLLIPETGQGMKRNDLIIFQYSLDASTQIERGSFMVLSGEETSGTATDPVLSQQDLLSNTATFDQMALWRISVSGAVISSPVQLFEVSKNIKNAGVPAVVATSSDGVSYSATVPGITELYAGLEVTIVPNMSSTSTAITLNVNDLGSKFVRLPISTNTALLAQPDQEGYYVENRPVKLIYDPKYASKGSWVVVGRQRQNSTDLYGAVPIEKGGTGAATASEALKNLGAAPSGFGLGYAVVINSVAELDNITAPGFYCVSATATIAGVTANYWYLFVYSYTDGARHCVQEMRPVGENGYKKLVRFRYTTSSTTTWYDWVDTRSAANITTGTLDADRLPVVPVTKGGTGATTAAEALTNLGAATATHNHSASDINSGTLGTARLPTVPATKGGTGATDGATGLKNLLAAGAMVLTSGNNYQYGDSLPAAGTKGRIFFKKVSS